MPNDDRFAGLDDAVGDVLHQQSQNAASTVRNNVVGAVGTNPEQSANYKHLAAFVGVPVGSVESDPNTVKQQAAVKQMDAGKLVQDYPHTARFMTDSQNVRIMHDDVPATAAVEQAIKAIPQGKSVMDSVGENLRSLVSADGYDNSAPVAFLKGLGGSYNKLAAAAGIVSGAFPTLYDKAASLITGQETTAASDSWFRTMAQPSINNIPAFDLRKDATVSETALHTVGNLVGMLSQIVLSGTGSGAVSPLAGQTVPAIFSGAVEHGAKSMLFPALSDAVNTGRDVYSQTGDASAAVKAAQMQYLTTSMAGVVPLSAAGSLPTRLATGFGSGVATSEVSRQLMNSALPTGMQQPFSAEQMIMGGLAGSMLGGVMGPRSPPGYHEAIRATYIEAARADQAQQTGETLTALGQLATASKLRERDPAAFRQFVQDISDDGHLQDVYIDAKELQNALNQSGVDQTALASRLPELAGQMHEALQLNGDVRIPVADYATHIAGGPIDAVILPHLKGQADGMTYKEAQEYFQSASKNMQGTAEKIANAHQDDQVAQAKSQAVYDHFADQLAAANRFPADVNKTYASLARDFYTTTAERLGMSPDELLARYPLEVKSESLEGSKTLDQGGLRRGSLVDTNGLTREGARNLVQGKAEELNKQLVSAGYQVEVTHSGSKAGPSSYLRIYDPQTGSSFAWDVRVSNHSKGVFNDQAVHNVSTPEDFQNLHEYLDSFRTPENISKFQNLKSEQSQKEVEIRLKSADRKLAKGKPLTRSEQEAVTNREGSLAGSKTLDQSARTDTEAFKTWFGSSEVIDKKGDPLIVYHGSNEDFNIFDASRSDGLWFTDNIDSIKSGAAGASGFKYIKRYYLKADNLQLNGSNHDVDSIRGEGFDGIKNIYDYGTDYAVLDANQVKSADNDGTFDANDPNILSQTKRGSISFGDDITAQPSVISLLKKADLSTFLHEMGHFFLEVQNDIAHRPDAPESIKADMQTTLDWFGVKDSQAWNGLTLEEKRDSHEKFARGFESYLMEGKAPSVAQQGMFSRFRSWLVNVYKSLSNLHVDLTPEVRGVFDRMLASSEAIRQAEHVRGFEPLFKSVPDGMTPEEFAAYQMLGAEATQHAIQDMEVRSLKDMKWLSNAKSAAIKSLQKTAAVERAKIREQVTKEVNAEPVNQAIEFLRRNTGDVGYKDALEKWNSEKSVEAESTVLPKEAHTAHMVEWVRANPKPIRKHTDIEKWETTQDAQRSLVAEQVKSEFLAKPEAVDLKGIKKGQYLARTGREIKNETERRLIEWVKENPRPDKPEKLPREFVAEMFGFVDENALNDAIKTSESGTEKIKGLTDQRMLEEHGELIDPVSIERAAESAIHNDLRARVLATEMKALADATDARIETGTTKNGRKITVSMMSKAAQMAAETAIAAKRLRDIRPGQYTAGEARAARNADKALIANDIRVAAIEKRAELLSNRLTRVSLDAIAEIEKSINYLKRFDKPKVRESVELEYRDQIDALLDRYDLRKSTTNAALDKRESLLNFVERQAAAGYPSGIPERLLNEAERMHYKDMTLEDFRGLVDAVKTIEHLGVLKNKLLDGKELRDMQAVVAEAKAITDKLPQRSPESNRGLTRIGSKWLSVKSAGRSLTASLLKMEQLMDYMDKRKSNGVYNRMVFRPISDAGVKEADMQAEIKAAFDVLIKSNIEDVTKDGNKIYVADGLIDGMTGKPQRFTKKEMLALAGNFGNESNFSKTTKGEKWNESVAEAFLMKNMNKADWDYIAGTGKALESLWPEKLAMWRRLGNTSPEKIMPRKFSTPHGDYDGWYWPMMYDPARSYDVADRNARSGDALFEDTYSRGNTDTGRMNTRNENYARPILLSIDAIPQVIQAEIHDIAYREAIINADKFLSNKTIHESIDNALSPQHYAQLKPWLQSIANDRKVDMKALKWFDQLAHGARTRATMVGLGYRLSTALVHGASAGLESVAELGPVWMAKGLADFAKPIQWVANKDFIFERSGEMRNRMNENERDTREHLRDIDLKLMNPVLGLVERGSLILKANAYRGIAMLDMASALPTWMGAYHKAMAKEGLNMSEQDAVYFADKTVRNAHGGGGVKDMAAIQRGPEYLKLFTMFYTFWNHNVNRLIATGSLAKSLPETYRNGEPGEFRGDLATVVMRTLAYTIGVQAIHAAFHPSKDEEGHTNWLKWASQMFALSATSGVPVIRDVAAHYIKGKPYTETPAGSIVGAVGNSGMDVMNAATGREPNPKWLKHSLNTAGYIFGLPLGQPASTAQFIWDVEQGKQNPYNTAEWLHGVMSGDAKKH